MHPVLIEFSKDFKIYSFGTFIVIAFLVSSWFVRRRAVRTLEVDGEQAFNVCFILLFIGLAGARMLYVLIEYEKHVEKPMSMFAIWNGGLVWYGGLIAGLLWLAWYLPRKEELKGWAFLDILAIGACLAIFVGRWAPFDRQHVCTVGGAEVGHPRHVGLAIRKLLIVDDGRRRGPNN